MTKISLNQRGHFCIGKIWTLSLGSEPLTVAEQQQQQHLSSSSSSTLNGTRSKSKLKGLN